MPTHSLGGGGPVGVGAPRPWRARPTLLSFSTNRGRPSWPMGGRRAPALLLSARPACGSPRRLSRPSRTRTHRIHRYILYTAYINIDRPISITSTRGAQRHTGSRGSALLHTGRGHGAGSCSRFLGGERSVLGKMEGPHPHRGGLGLGQRGEDPRACTGRVGVLHAAPSPTSSQHPCPPLLGEKGSVLPNSMPHCGGWLPAWL